MADDGLRLAIEDVETGERLLSSVEKEAARRAAEERAEQAEERAEQAEERAEQEAAARRVAEERTEQGLRGNVEDLCSILGVEWSAPRRAVVETMGSSQLELLRRYLVSEKSWPESVSSPEE